MQCKIEFVEDQNINGLVFYFDDQKGNVIHCAVSLKHIWENMLKDIAKMSEPAINALLFTTLEKDKILKGEL